MKPTAPAFEAVTEATERLHAAGQTERAANRVVFDAGVSLHQIAKKVLLAHEQVRRIIRNRKPASPTAYRVTVERRGVAPLEAQLVVRAASERAAGELATCLAERKRGGMFEPTHVRAARRDEVPEYDDAAL
jgi:hypothetical protein